MIQFGIELEKLPNINNGYIKAKGRVFRSSEARNFCNLIELEARRAAKDFKVIHKKFYFSLTTYWYNPKFYTKKGEINKRAGDIDSFVKFSQDAIMKGVGYDDSLIKQKDIIQMPCEGSYHKIFFLLVSHPIESIKSNDFCLKEKIKNNQT